MRALATGVVLAALASSGCSDHACFAFANSQGVCPSKENAATLFGRCTDIQSIDGDGELDGDNCCYEVTRQTRGLVCAPPPSSGTGGGGSDGSINPGEVVGHAVVGAGGAPTHTTSAHSSTGGASSALHSSTHASSSASASSTGGAPVCEDEACGFEPNEPLRGCLACAEQTVCNSLSLACDASDDCVQYEACISTCEITQTACLEDCASMYPGGVALFSNYIDCEICTGCQKACKSSPASKLAKCGGAGGADGSGGVGGIGGIANVGGMGGAAGGLGGAGGTDGAGGLGGAGGAGGTQGVAGAGGISGGGATSAPGGGRTSGGGT